MGDFASLITTETKRPGSPCLVCTALAEFTGDDLKDLTAALDRAGVDVPYVAITRALRARGYPVGDNAVNRHLDESRACGPIRR